MKIPRSYVDRYSRSLNVVGERAKAQLAAALSQIDYTADVATVRNEILSVMRLYCGASSTLSARLAAEFYNGLRRKFGLSGFEAEPLDAYDDEALEGAVRAIVDPLVKGKPPESVIALCLSRLGYEVNRSANMCVARNAAIDPVKTKWARVPTGLETCDFCLMLASRGFDYHSEQTASHAHDNCNCRAVPSWDVDNPLLEGYDDEQLYRDWGAAVDRKAEERAARNGTTAEAERKKIMDNYNAASRRAKQRRKGKR